MGVRGGAALNRHSWVTMLALLLGCTLGIATPATAATDTETVFVSLEIPPYIEIKAVNSGTVYIPPTWTFVDNFVYEGWKTLRDVLVSEKVRVSEHVQVRSNIQQWHINAAVVGKDHHSLQGVRILVALKPIGISGSYQEHGLVLLSENDAGRTLFNRWWNGTGVTRFDAEYQAVAILSEMGSEPPKGTITILYTVTSN